MVKTDTQPPNPNIQGCLASATRRSRYSSSSLPQLLSINGRTNTYQRHRFVIVYGHILPRYQIFIRGISAMGPHGSTIIIKEDKGKKRETTSLSHNVHQ